MSGKAFTVLIGCYGDFPDYSVRALRSVLDHAGPRLFEVLVGCNACGPATLRAARAALDAGDVAALVESRANRNKDPMMRALVGLVRTKYLLWMDDDSHFTDPRWPERVTAFLGAARFDVAGHVFYMHRSPEYRAFLRERPWWVGEDHYKDEDHRDRVWFATGGLWMARTAFLRAHDFPDPAMTKMHDDLLLGDLVSQKQGTLIHFPDDLMAVLKISDGDRRGTGEASHWTNE
ncbi:MAG TPA: glycosyltransferase [Gemmataceae bacterium]|jgi:hypothetical protein|nr:glycosyltransferase [Gemmataceae bacterium]